MMQRLAGKTAIVTGAGTGIGAATAVLFAREGAAVVVADLEEAAAAKVAEEISATGGHAAACPVDIRESAQIDAMLAFTRERFGAANVLVNNAGRGSQKHFLDTPLETLRLMLDINVVGTFLCAQAAAREMMKLGGGRIVNVASHSALLGSSGRAAYAASKGGIVAMTRVMAVDLAEHRIYVNAVAPGPIDVPRSRAQHNEERRSGWQRAVPVGRYGDPHEVATAILYLASDEATYVNGQTLAVDGGFTAAGLRVKQL
jgi:3-oxoacyl-[acyl-carrier protein] reductase